jgi:molybdopterin molybdotransferase
MLLKMAGQKQIFRKEVEAKLLNDIKKKKGRLNWVRVFLSQKNGCFYAQPTGAQSSGILTSMVADGIAIIEEDKDLLRKGQTVKVICLGNDYH